MLLLDTNVISEVRKSTCHPNVKAWMAAQSTDAMYICAITVLEIQRGISLSEQRGDKQQAAVFTRWLEGKVLPAFAGRILPVDHVVARRAAQLPWADAQDYRDPLISATGLVHGATVVTRNVKHFETSGVPLLNPWEYDMNQIAANDTVPTLEAVQALHGRELAMLNAEEIEVFRFYRDRGRKYGVAVTVETDADDAELARASRQQAEEILRRARTKISVSADDSHTKHRSRQDQAPAQE